MNNLREMFYRHIAQTSPAPLALEIVKAKGCKLIDKEGHEYLDLIAGISVSNVGHGNKKIIKAINKQAADYLHLLVYGEMIESPQVRYATLLTEHLPANLNSVYFTNSGAEATEGAMKLAKRVTGRSEIIAFNQSYHGSTQGALSIIGDEYWRNAFRPLLPCIQHLDYNSTAAIEAISTKTACVFAETIQAERGVHPPTKQWLQLLRKKCTETGTLLVFDEIQTGFGRTGSLWGFERFAVIPDIVLLGKALGGGMPLGAFVANYSLMNQLSKNPVLGHITTFGGHPVCCAAGMAAMKVLLDNNLIAAVEEKAAMFRKLLQHDAIVELRSEGLLIAIELKSQSEVFSVTKQCLEDKLIVDWFLFASHCIRIAPPLTITPKEIRKACKIILKSLNTLAK
ncbi:MAG: aspartate aminotransferase family protein [Chitinophagaceae bacterium]|nr:aspartate aminotransferase family protein [Chitinophagaceae bacterium]